MLARYRRVMFLVLLASPLTALRHRSLYFATLIGRFCLKPLHVFRSLSDLVVCGLVFTCILNVQSYHRAAARWSKTSWLALKTDGTLLT